MWRIGFAALLVICGLELLMHLPEVMGDSDPFMRRLMAAILFVVEGAIVYLIVALLRPIFIQKEVQKE